MRSFMKAHKRLVLKIIAFSLCFLFSGTAISFSYLFGSSQKKCKYYSALMSLDSKVKKQKQTDFLHGIIEYNNDVNETQKYDMFLKLQTRTKTQYNYYNSFLVSSNQEEFIEYDFEYLGKDSFMSCKSKLVEVATYYDFNYMESLGLPLYRTLSTPSKITPKNGAKIGSYISATRAEEIVSNNGMLADSNNNLEEAFNKLLDDASFTFTISNNNVNDGQEIELSVNNIYLDYSHSYLLNGFQNQVQKTRYGEYSRSFDYWFGNSVLTFSPSIFDKGCSFVFDIRRNYGNFDRFFNSVVGYNYGEKGFSISFLDEKGNDYKETKIMNSVSSSKTSSVGYVFLVLAIILFLVTILSFEFFYKIFCGYQRLLFSLIPISLFSIGQVIFSILSTASFEKYLLYLCFNSTGNIVVLLAVILILANAAIWSYYVTEHKK